MRIPRSARNDGEAMAATTEEVIQGLEYLGLEVSGHAREVCEEAAQKLFRFQVLDKIKSSRLRELEQERLKEIRRNNELTENNFRLSEKIDELREKLAELSGGEFVDMAFAVYDQRETIENCTVEILTNSKTGEVSVGWTRSKPEEEADSPQIQE